MRVLVLAEGALSIPHHSRTLMHCMLVVACLRYAYGSCGFLCMYADLLRTVFDVASLPRADCELQRLIDRIVFDAAMLKVCLFFVCLRRWKL